MRTSFFLIIFALFFFSCQNDQANSNNSEEDAALQNQAPEGQGTEFGFVASGNNPTWNLKMDFDNQMVFELTEDNGAGINFTVPTPDPFKMNNPEAIRYRGTSATWNLMVTIFPFACQDSKTGDRHANQVIIKVTSNETPYEETLQGCGDYQGEYSFGGTQIPQPN